MCSRPLNWVHTWRISLISCGHRPAHPRADSGERTIIEKDAELTSIFEQVDSSISEALEAFAAFDNVRAEKVRRQMEPLAQSARDFMVKFGDAVGKNPERAGFYVSLIIVARSLEQIIYLVESITGDIIYVAE